MKPYTHQLFNLSTQKPEASEERRHNNDGTAARALRNSGPFKGRATPVAVERILWADGNVLAWCVEFHAFNMKTRVLLTDVMFRAMFVPEPGPDPLAMLEEGDEKAALLDALRMRRAGVSHPIPSVRDAAIAAWDAAIVMVAAR